MEGLRREDAPQESTWDSKSVYQDWQAWQKDFNSANSDLNDLARFTGKLGDGPAVLLDWFNAYNSHYQSTMKLLTFSTTAIFIDSNDQEAKSAYEQAVSLLGNFKAATAFAKPELLAIGKDLFDGLDHDPELEKYHHYFDDLFRSAQYSRSAEVEELLNLVIIPFEGVYNTANELTNRDLKFLPATDSQGNNHPVRQATQPPTGIQSPDRIRRKTSWENYCDSYRAMENTLASNYITSVKQQVFFAKTRGYNTVLELMLSPSNLPIEIFYNMIETFKANLPVWHKYWDIKRKVLGVDALHPYDIWAPIVKSPPFISFYQAVDWISEAMSPLGSEYVDTLRHGCLEERWVDYAPNIGKNQGAASSLRVADKPPFIFMSYIDDIMSLSTLSHELGHSLHLHYAYLNQPEIYNDYELFSSAIAETASNFNQAMTREHLRKSKKDDRNFQLSLIEEAFSNFHRYFFIMPTLARFEFEVFNRAQQDQPLNASILNGIMMDLFSEGYGDTLIDDPERTAITWAQFPHLYNPFYTFQYSVGISAAHGLEARVMSAEPDAANNYLEFLKAGTSLYPIQLWELAGVDMTTPEPVETAFSLLDNLIEELALLSN